MALRLVCFWLPYFKGLSAGPPTQILRILGRVFVSFLIFWGFWASGC